MSVKYSPRPTRPRTHGSSHEKAGQMSCPSERCLGPMTLARNSHAQLLRPIFGIPNLRRNSKAIAHAVCSVSRNSSQYRLVILGNKSYASYQHRACQFNAEYPGLSAIRGARFDIHFTTRQWNLFTIAEKIYKR